MDPFFLENNEFFQNLFDSIPSPIFIVDDDVRILYLNSAATETFGFIKEGVYRKRGGDALGCIHSTEDPRGCGHAGFCKDCVVRSSVQDAIRGDKIIRKKTKMEFLKKGKIIDAHILVTTSPLKHGGKTFSILIMEDISELLQLRSLLPICANCKRIHDDKNYWETVETYIESHIDVQFSHSICPECSKILYPEIHEEGN
ncbi:MAG: PAS domain S-box protein [Nitrospinae bacterium]|nr:PAS domain S-box protein [Nitrospinota bacterium]